MANTSVKLKNIKIPLRTNFFFNSKHNIFKRQIIMTNEFVYLSSDESKNN
jgi:hypothetical protein